MQLIYRGVRVQPMTAAQKTAVHMPKGAYRGLPLSFDARRKSNLNVDASHHLKYRGVSYEH